MILLVVDTQKLITNTGLYNFEIFRSRMKELISQARNNGIEVIYVRHDDGEGQELSKGTDGFEIYDEFAPAEGELIFDKTVNSSFNGTGLLEYLRKKEENTVIVAGLQTDYCMDATIKCGFEHGFRMIVPAGTNSTFDNEFMSAEMTYHYYNDFMWKGRYAECIAFEETLDLMENRIPKKIKVNQTEYEIIQLLGHGKGGYSYLAQKDGKQYVLKQIHHEPCDYYSFGNKIEAERRDYNRLAEIGIRIPKMLDLDIANERIIKEYVEGPTIYELVKNDTMKDTYLVQMREMAKQVYAAGLNIDYFPTNFIVQEDLIYYIDYECNDYMEEWNFENWGIKYWSKTQEFIDYVNQHS